MGVLMGVVAVLAGCGDKKLDESFSDLEVGDCIADSSAQEVESVDTVDCEQEGALRVVGIFDIEGYGDDFPGTGVIDVEAVEGCPEAMDFYLIPLEDSWEQANDREVVCLEQI